MKRISILFCIVYGIAIVTSQFLLTYNLPWIYAASSEYAESNPGFIEDTLVYLNFQKNSLGYLEVYLTAKEASHMNDVRFLFSLYYVIMIQSIIFTGILACYIAITSRTRNALWNVLKRSSYVLAGLIAAIALSLAFFFKPLFLLFHKVAFTNNDWLLPRDSTLIRLFPEQTFVIIVSITLLSTLFLHLLLGLSMTYADNYTKRKAQ